MYSKEILKFLGQNQDLLEENNWRELYERLHPNHRPELTQIAMEFDVDPLEYLTDEIPGYYGWQCALPEEITIKGSVNYIGIFSFCESTNLKRLKIQSGVRLIAGASFCNCKDLESVEAEGDLEAIYGEAFINCDSLKKVVLNGVNNLGGSFYNCPNIEVLTIGKLVQYEPRCFYGCNKIKQAAVTGSIVEFIDKSNMESLVISGIGNVRTGMLKGAHKLTFLSLPDVGTIPAFSFKDCDSLQRILYHGQMKDWERATSASSRWKDGLPSNCVIECSDGIVNVT